MSYFDILSPIYTRFPAQNGFIIRTMPRTKGSISRSKDWPRIKKKTNSRGKKIWEVDTLSRLGKRERKTYPTKLEAEAYARTLRKKHEDHGVAAFIMPEEDRVDAKRALKLLKDSGIPSLTEAARIALRYHVKQDKRITVEQLANEFLTEKSAPFHNLRAPTIRELKSRIGRFTNEFGQMLANEMTEEIVEGWIRGQKVSAQTQIHYRTKLKELFTYAERQGNCAIIPISDYNQKVAQKAAERARGTPKIYTVGQVRKILNTALETNNVWWEPIAKIGDLFSVGVTRIKWSKHKLMINGEVASKGNSDFVMKSHAGKLENNYLWLKSLSNGHAVFRSRELEFKLEGNQVYRRREAFNMLPYFTIGLFCGIRPNEILNLDWEYIDLEEKKIHLGATETKTRWPRSVTISDNALEWLLLCDQRQSIRPKNFQKREQEVFRISGVTKSPDAARHTMATMSLDHFRDKDRLNTEMGHTDDRMMAHYQGLTKGIKSDQFWQIVPPNEKLVIGLDDSHFQK